MNDLPTLHDKANDAMVRLLSSRVLDMRRRAGDISQAIEKPTGSAPVRIDAPGQANTGSDIGGCEGGGVKL